MTSTPNFIIRAAALKDGTDIESLDLYDNMVGYAKQHNDQNPENEINVLDVFEFIRRDIERMSDYESQFKELFTGGGASDFTDQLRNQVAEDEDTATLA